MNTIPPECAVCGVIDSDENPVEPIPYPDGSRSCWWKCERCASAAGEDTK